MKIEAKTMRLYAVSSRDYLKPGEDLARVTETLLQNGVTFFQLREKDADHETFLRLAKQIKPVCAKYGVPFVINDDVAVALECDADGVHVGQEDAALAEARRILGPDKIIGVSCHNAAEAKAALEGGADYIGCGSCFATGTKQNVVDLSYEELCRIKQTVGSLPIVAIGGISAQNMALLKGSGANGCALVSALFGAPDKAEAARSLRALADENFED